MPSARQVLASDPEKLPSWLLSDPQQFDPEQFFSSRVVYYPGSGTDGQSVEVFCGSHSTHCVVHVDFSRSATQVMGALDPANPHHLRGYAPRVQKLLPPDEFLAQLKLDDEFKIRDRQPLGDRPDGVASALWSVLERQSEFGDEHGPRRIALLHIQAEAFWVCRSIWRTFDRVPYAILLQDHGFGGNFPGLSFGGRKSLLFNYLLESKAFLPRWLLVAANTGLWPGYHPVSDPTGPGGERGQSRRLFQKVPDWSLLVPESIWSEVHGFVRTVEDLRQLIDGRPELADDEDVFEPEGFFSR